MNRVKPSVAPAAPAAGAVSSVTAVAAQATEATEAAVGLPVARLFLWLPRR